MSGTLVTGIKPPWRECLILNKFSTDQEKYDMVLKNGILKT